MTGYAALLDLVGFWPLTGLTVLSLLILGYISSRTNGGVE